MLLLNKLPIGLVLKSKGLITEKQLGYALSVQAQNKSRRLGDILIELGYVSDSDFYGILAERLNVAFMDADQLSASPEAVKLISESMARKLKVVPLDIMDGILNVATNDPLDLFALEDVRMATGMPVVAVLAKKQSIERAIDRYYSEAAAKEMANNIVTDEKMGADARQFEEIEDRVDSTPVVKIINTIIYQAIVRSASDIHIEPKKDKVVVRMRIDGMLVEYMTLAYSAHKSIVTRLKILGELNIAEKRIPQDGRFDYNYGGGNIDIRVSVLPSVHGEKVVLRLLGGTGRKLRTLKELGMTDYNYKLFTKMIKSPNGIILVTGPTGSGKTTTLYSVLADVAKPTVNITTIEDPVEIILPVATQVQVCAKTGLTFQAGLRSILRQDPDVIMVGEIRDQETASIAMRAAITGHLVLSTIHTNDSVSTIMRLVDMGVEPYLVASSLTGIVAQRLVRLICPHCKRAMKATENDCLQIGANVEEIYVGEGCPKCQNTGYLGRSAIHELVLVDERLRAMILKSASADEMREYAAKNGTRSLRANVGAMVAKGLTTIEELVRTTYTI